MQGAATGHAASQSLRFARAKFRPTALPATLVIRSALHDQLTAGARPAPDRGGGVGWRGQERAVVELGSGKTTGHYFVVVLR